MNIDRDLNNRIDRALLKLKGELFAAMSKHRGMHSPHEGHSVIREELDELWEHVRADTGDTDEARKEAMQVAAMGLRYALDLCAPFEEPKSSLLDPEPGARGEVPAMYRGPNDPAGAL